MQSTPSLFRIRGFEMDDMTTEVTEPSETVIREGLLWSTRMIHLYDPDEPRLPGVPVERAPSLCGLRPVWPTIWMDPAEANFATIECKRCAKVRGAWERV